MTIRVQIRKAIKCNGEHALFLAFDYDAKVVEAVREFPSRYWHADFKLWELPFKCLGELLDKLPDCDFDIFGDYVSLEKPEVEIPDGFRFKTNPYEYQIDGFNFGLQNDRWLLGDEMGLGKTKQIIDIAIAKKLEKHYSHCLIICGVNGLKWNWRNEIRIHSDEPAWILGQRWKGNKLQIGSNADKLADVKALKTGQLSDNYFIITNIETLRDDAIVSELQSLCKSKTIGMIAFDECHKAKNPQSQQGKGLLKLFAKNMVAMTGTPLMNTPEDLFIILRWLGYEKHNFYAFKQHYCIYGGYGGYQITGYKNMNELQEQLNEIMLRRRKEDVLDLPEKTYIEEYVEMTPKQAKIYKEVSAEIKENIDKIKMANNPLAELIRMRQATGFTGILSSEIQESAKIDRMLELVEEAKQNGRKVVIFSNWTQMTSPIAQVLKNAGITCGIITGETKENERQTLVDDFQNGKYDVMLGTSGAMGTGLTLTAGTIEIFMDEPWNNALKEQCVDRCHRIGQKSNLTIYTLMCEGTIDERIHELVVKKGLMADALVDGKVVGNVQDMLDFLLS